MLAISVWRIVPSPAPAGDTLRHLSRSFRAAWFSEGIVGIEGIGDVHNRRRPG